MAATISTVIIMKITNISYLTKNGKTVASADVLHRGKIDNLYFEVNSRIQNFFPDDATPFLAAVLYPAMKCREDIFIDGTVSEKVLNGVYKIMSSVEAWNVGLKSVKIHADVMPDKKAGSKKALFFSAGVDSLYTLLTHNRSKKIITHFIFSHGMDIPLAEKELYATTLRNIQKVARYFNITVITVKTNIRDFTGKYVKWDFAHGPVLGSIAILLRGNFNEIFISGGMNINHIRPFGSHPHIDPLWSSEKMIVNHYGSHTDRLGKIESEIVKSKLALSVLRVCWRNKNSQYNCGECEKCLRTMLSLYTSGSLLKCKTFNKPINLEVLENLYVVKNHIRYFRENLVALEKTTGNERLVSSIRKCISNNEERSVTNLINITLRNKIGELDEKYFNGKIFQYASKKSIV